MAPPNFLLIMSDQHSPHLLGAAGNRHVDTPHLDALARRGIRMDNAYCAAPVCVASRMSFLTGRTPCDLGVWQNSQLLDPYTPTFAHSLSLAGYDTVLCGRMHFDGPDQHHGFRQRLVGDVSGARDTTQPLFDGRIPEHTVKQDYRSVLDAGPGRSSYIAFDDEVTRRACDYLKKRDSASVDESFCLMVGYLLPHNPYICPEPLFEKYLDRVALPEVCEDEATQLHPAVSAWHDRRGTNRIGREAARRCLAAYYGLVEYMDQRLGEVLNTLGQTRFIDDTVVLYCSDHGEMAGEHGMWWKECFYEASVRVPMIWSCPGRFPGGGSHEQLASLMDVGPTCLSLADADPLPNASGRSLRSLLETNDASGLAGRVFAEMYPSGLSPARMIRRGRWKLCHFHGHIHPQLFDLVNDPEEQHDLGGSDEHADVRDQLLAEVLDGWDGADVQCRAAAHRQDAQIIRNWRDLGPPGASELWRAPPDCNRFSRRDT